YPAGPDGHQEGIEPVAPRHELGMCNHRLTNLRHRGLVSAAEPGPRNSEPIERRGDRGSGAAIHPPRQTVDWNVRPPSKRFSDGLLHRMVQTLVALDRPAFHPRQCQHRGVLAGTVAENRSRFDAFADHIPCDPGRERGMTAARKGVFLEPHQPEPFAGDLTMDLLAIVRCTGERQVPRLKAVMSDAAPGYQRPELERLGGRAPEDRGDGGAS